MELIKVANGHLDELQKAEFVSKSNLVPSVFIKNTLPNKSQVIHFIREVVVTDRFHCHNSGIIVLPKWNNINSTMPVV